MRKPMPLNLDFEQYNNNNLHEYDPYVVHNEEILIDGDWWDTLTLFTQNQIKSKVKNFQLGKVETPHDPQSNQNNDLHNIYEAYLDGFDYHLWYNKDIPNGPKGVKMVHLTDDVKQKLLNNEYPRSLKNTLVEICDELCDGMNIL